MPNALNKVTNSKVLERLSSWGKCIHTQRVAQRITEIDFCARIGISRPTLHRMQKGSPNVSADTYLEAFVALGVIDIAAPQLPTEIVQPVVMRPTPAVRVRRTKMELDDDF
jgi:hypothetical protein